MAIRCIGIIQAATVGVFALFVGTLVLGCSGGPKLYAVEGEVLVDGEPLAKGTVTLWADGAKGNQFKGQSTGDVEGGKFKIMTQGNAGAPVGWYKVTVIATETIDSSKASDAGKAVTKNAIDERFRAADKTTLEFEVVPAPAAGAYTLKVSGKK